MSAKRPTLCAGRKANGFPCAAFAGASGFCYFHDPRRREQAHDARSRGGARKRKAVPAVLPDTGAALAIESPEDCLSLLTETIANVQTGRLSPQIGTVVSGLARNALAALEHCDTSRRLAAIEAELRRRARK